MGILSVAFGSPSKVPAHILSLFRPLAEHFSALSFIPTPIMYYNIGLVDMTFGRELIGTC